MDHRDRTLLPAPNFGHEDVSVKIESTIDPMSLPFPDYFSLSRSDMLSQSSPSDDSSSMASSNVASAPPLTMTGGSFLSSPTHVIPSTPKHAEEGGSGLSMSATAHIPPLPIKSPASIVPNASFPVGSNANPMSMSCGVSTTNAMPMSMGFPPHPAAGPAFGWRYGANVPLQSSDEHKFQTDWNSAAVRLAAATATAFSDPPGSTVAPSDAIRKLSALSTSLDCADLQQVPPQDLERVLMSQINAVIAPLDTERLVLLSTATRALQTKFAETERQNETIRNQTELQAVRKQRERKVQMDEVKAATEAAANKAALANKRRKLRIRDREQHLDDEEEGDPDYNEEDEEEPESEEEEEEISHGSVSSRSAPLPTTKSSKTSTPTLSDADRRALFRAV